MKPMIHMFVSGIFLSIVALAQQANDPQTVKPTVEAARPTGGDVKSVTGSTAVENVKSIHEFVMKNIDGEDVPLSRYKGRPILVVNVASQCGLTPQYEQLQKLHDTFGPKGLAVIGIPANNFGGQEPGSNGEIKKFCTDKFRVSFDMFAKVSVKGDDCCDLYRWLTSEAGGGKYAGEIKWNFTKFLIDADGKVIARFEPRTRPDDKQVVDAIEKALVPSARSLR